MIRRLPFHSPHPNTGRTILPEIRRQFSHIHFQGHGPVRHDIPRPERTQPHRSVAPRLPTTGLPTNRFVPASLAQDLPLQIPPSSPQPTAPPLGPSTGPPTPRWN